MTGSREPYWPWERDDLGIRVDGRAMDQLAFLFAECRELGLLISEHMPLDTPGHQREAAAHLSRLVSQARRREGDL